MYLHAPATPSTCTNCGVTSRWFFHYVHLRNTERHLCTSCVLRLHPSSFCPSCFEFFDHPLSTSSAAPNRFLSCVKCSSLTHVRCLPSPPPSASTFLCPPCSTPSPSSYSFFQVDHSAPPHNLDTKLASVLLCASKIASSSLNRYHSFARVKADRSVRESAAARKKAKDALDHLSAVENAKRAATAGVSGSRNLGIHKVTNPVSVNANGNGLSDNKNGFGGNNGIATATGTSEDVKLERVQSNNGANDNK
ncbi:hypothetical protein Ahy_B06g080886 isoform B [Arachis hypogaea]|uniref:Zinc finger PHD-type domain-containing protein n=1 Tax=Arachis hypogaea TaxID=3818 RepID=A0A444YJJ4_ARAHY|nr:hypothetical protein Ahy_B06g080886 isoform B [Arachis hypogaea]